MSLLRLFRANGTAPVARERLQILLAHERVALGPEDLVGKLRDDLIATISRHVEIDPGKVIVKMDRGAAFATLEIDIEIPSEKIVGDGKRRPRDANGRFTTAA
jgi:cell division topological specificity factor